MHCINTISCITLLFIFVIVFLSILHSIAGPFPVPCHNSIIFCIIICCNYIYSILYNENCTLSYTSHQVNKITVFPISIFTLTMANAYVHTNSFIHDAGLNGENSSLHLRGAITVLMSRMKQCVLEHNNNYA